MMLLRGVCKQDVQSMSKTRAEAWQDIVMLVISSWAVPLRLGSSLTLAAYWSVQLGAHAAIISTNLKQMPPGP